MKRSEHSVSDDNEQVSLYLWTGRLRINYITYTTDAVWIPFITFVPLYILYIVLHFEDHLHTFVDVLLKMSIKENI